MNKAMRTLLVVIAAAALLPAAVAQRKPTYEEARQLSEAIREVVARTGRWHKMSMADRLQEIRNAEGLVDKAGRMFGTAPAGPFGDCWGAANFAKGYVINLNDLALLRDRPQREISSADLFAPPFNAFGFGQLFNACENVIKELGSSGAKRKG